MRLWVKILVFIISFCCVQMTAQTTIVDYDFNAVVSYPISPSSTAAGVTCTGTSTETFQTYGGTASGGAAFTNNATAGNALGMSNSSGANTRYFQFQLGGANLNTYCCYKIYLQAQRSGTGAQTITLQYSTDGISYTAFGTTGSPGNGSYTEITFDLCTVPVTAINNQAAVYFRLYVSGATGTGTLRIDNFEVQATTTCGAGACSPPTSAATGVSFSGVSTTGLTTNWTSGNGTYEIVVMSTNNAPPTPTDGTSYTGNTVYGSGTTMGAGYYTVYSGVAATTVSITGLSCNTQYYIYIFEYSNTGTGSPCYYTTSVTNNTTTSACTGTLPAYPQLTGVILDACNSSAGTPSCATLNGSTAGNCSEGRSEVTFFRAGTTAITAAAVQGITANVINLYTTPWSVLQYYSGASMNNTAVTTSLNSIGCAGATCGSCFQDAWSTGIPAGATFIMVCDYYCVGNTDFTNLCGSATTSPIYVIYFGASTNNSSACGGGTTGQWSASGNYTNNGASSIKGISIDISSLVAGAPILYYQYDISLEANGDGAGAAWGAGGATTGAAASPSAYTSTGCALPIVLPVSLLEFLAAKTNENNIAIKWSTGSENNSDYFSLEYSVDGQKFIPWTKVKAAGNSSTEKKYSATFKDESGTDVYFRLKQFDFNGNYKYSNIISSLESSLSVPRIYFSNTADKIVTKFHLDNPAMVNITLEDLQGRFITASGLHMVDKGDNEIQIESHNLSGVYIVTYQSDDAVPIRKKIVVYK
jgi:hypothetical protein